MKKLSCCMALLLASGLFSPPAAFAETVNTPPEPVILICPKQVSAYDPKDASRLIGNFLQGSKLEITGSPDSRGMVRVIFRPSEGASVDALCRADELGMSRPDAKSAPKAKITPQPTPEAGKPEELKKHGKPMLPGVFEETWIMPGTLYGNPKIKVGYRIPLGADGKPGNQAHNVVFYAPFMQDSNIQHKEWAEKMGYTIFSLFIKTDLNDVEDRKKCYYYPESGWPDVAFAVQERLEKEYSLPHRKLLIIGRSGGASMAEQMMLYHPEKIEAVAMAGGSNYNPMKEKLTIPLCIFVTRGDTRIPDNRELAKKTRSLGMNMLYAETTPRWTSKGTHDYLHGPDEFSLSVQESFLAGVAQLRDQGIGSPEKWPFLASTKDPRKVFPNTAQEQEKILATERMFFPSSEFVELWQKLPLPEEPFSFSESGVSLEGVITRPLGTPKGVIIFHHIWNDQTRAEIVQDLHYLSTQGFVVISAGLRNGLDGLEDARALTRWVLRQERFQSYPVFLAGFGLGGRLAILSACDQAQARIKAVAAISTETEWPFPELSPADHVSSLAAPLLLIYGGAENNSGRIEGARQFVKTCQSRGKQAEIDVFVGVDSSLEKKWFEGLDKVASHFMRFAAP